MRLTKLHTVVGKTVKYIINSEKRITSELKLLKHKEIIDESSYKNIKPGDSKANILYRLLEIYKKLAIDFHLFAFSDIGTPTNKLAKFLLQFLKPSKTNANIVIDSFIFAEENCQQEPNYTWLV